MEQKRNQLGVVAMTAAREWPTKAADDRDRAAENINEASIKLEKVASKLQPEYRADVLDSVVKLQKAARLLERNGASTCVPVTTF